MMPMKKSKINNLTELRAEILRLKTFQEEQENYLSDQYRLLEQKVQAPFKFISGLFSWFPGFSSVVPSSTQVKEGEDWVTKSLRLGLPYVLNRFFFRRAGAVKKLLVAILSQQAAGALNKDRISGLISKVSELIRPKSKRKGKVHHQDYGIPPDSETY